VTGSNSIPEYNPLNYPLQSFDLSDNPSSSTNVQHIRSINDAGRNAPLDDHTFVDDSGDVPFSVSFWINQSSTAAGIQYIMFKGATATGRYEWTIYGSSTSLICRLHGAGSSTDYMQILAGGALSAGSWQHYVLTYDGSTTVNGLNIYKNGSLLSPSRTTNGTYSGMSPSNLALCVGSAFTSTAYGPSASDLIGKLYSIAIWKNRVVSSIEVSALYNAYINGPGGEARSGFISRSPRLMLRELDDLPGSYSTVRRTGDPTRTGALTSNFDDTTSIVFSGSENPVFPSMLPKGSSFRSQAVDIVGQDSDISASLPVRSFQHPNHLHYSPTEAVGPFDENRVMPATDFFLSGTDPDILPGFTSPLRSKIAIEIDITPTSDFTLTRNYSIRNPGTQDRTGFAYFNFADKLWQDVGLRDPVTGGSLEHDVAFNALTTAFPVLSGSQGILSQFVGVFNLANYLIGSATGSLTVFSGADFGGSAYSEDSLVQLRKLMSHACSPSVINGAPFNARYFATSSQILKLEDQKKMLDPMLLEAVSMKMDVEVQCYFTASLADTGRQIARYFMPANNYVFFLYSQKKGYRSSTLTVAESSGSTRSLIASASVSFAHAAATSPTHGPALLFTLTSSNPLYPTNNPVVVQYTGSLDFTFRPGVCSRKWTVSHRPTITSSATEQTRNFQHFWPGGPSAVVFNNESWTFQRKGSLLPTLTIFGTSGSDVDANSRSVLNSYHFRSLGGEVASPISFELDAFSTAGALVSNEDGRVESPYLLMPEDEIILGIEQVPMNFNQNDPENDFTIYQSSSMTIKSNSAKLTLHGSLIRDSREANLSLNQNLSSNSIHEIIGAEPQLDQFQIEPASSYYGSYLDDIVTGSMASPILAGTVFITAGQDQSRRLISRVSLGQAGITGSLQRFVKMNDSTERTYDSCLPSYADFFDGDVNFQVRTVNEVLGIKVQEHELVKWMPGVDDGIVEKGSFFSNQFPFKNNPTRRLSLNGTLASGSSLAGGIYASDLPQFRDYGLYSTYDNYTNFRTSDWAYRVGYSFTNVYDTGGGDRTYVGIHREKAADVLLTAEPNYELELGTYRYGISNLLPEFSSTRWRPDHYGHLRDMLEPRQHSATFDGIKPVKIRFVSGSTNVDPMLTYSQNLSTFATSSMPFFDDDIARNRPDNPDESLVDVIA
jgi:hypothetical protein